MNLILFCVSILLMAFLVFSVYAYLQEQDKKAKAIEAENLEAPVAGAVDPHEAEVLSRIPGIVCWGDDLTAGTASGSFPEKLEKLMSENAYYIPVVNMGVGGEDSRTIMARAGALEILVDPFTIPAAETPVQITFRASDGSALSLLGQGGRGITNVSIKGIDGVLSASQESPPTGDFAYYFTRNTAGQAVSVPPATRVINDGSYLYKDYIPVICIGQDNQWETPKDLVAQQQAILDTCGKNRDRFIILGLISESAEARAVLEQYMEEYWGSHYINLREYLSSYGVYDAKLTPDDTDLELMQRGIVPRCLRADDIRLNSDGYAVVANLLYNRLAGLGYIEK